MKLRVTLELELRDDWKEVVISDDTELADAHDAGEGVSDEEIIHSLKESLEYYLNNQECNLGSLGPAPYEGIKVTFVALDTGEEKNA